MHVDFDSLRVRLIESYNRLAKTMNKNIKDKSFDPHVVVDVEEITEEMEDLRQFIVSIGCCYCLEAGINELPEFDTVEFNPEP